MLKLDKKTFLHDTFIFSIAIKGIDGILELIGGICLLFIRSDLIVNLVSRLFQHELVQDPTDILANHLIQASQHLSTSALAFASLYLIIHGSIKIGLVTGLWTKKMWAYPTAGIILTIFVIYQTIRFFNTHSRVLLFLTSIDVIILFLLRSEYRRLKKTRR